MSETEKQNYYDSPYPGDYGPHDNNFITLELLRKDLIGELEAINQYERHAKMAPIPEASRLFHQIANDERHHVAELMHLIMKLDPEQREEMLKEMEKRKGPLM